MRCFIPEVDKKKAKNYLALFCLLKIYNLMKPHDISKKIFISMFIQSCLMLLYFIKTVYFRCYIPPADMILKKIPAADKK